MQEIINITQYGDALRNTGYKNIESAVSEIIDNSIEAGAKDTIVFVSETIPSYSGRRHVTEIAFLDNGSGMDKDLLQSCLRIGYGTRTDRRGMGRFGVGLPQASLHVCPLVEVFSWQGGIENCRKSFLDIYKIKAGEQTGFDEPTLASLPEKYQKYVSFNSFDRSFDFTQSGTLVVWRDCDNVKPVTVKPLFDRLEFELGKKFRHLIKNGERNIFLLHAENEHHHDRRVMPNDPLFLMTPNLVLGNLEKPGDTMPRNNTDFTEPFFIPYANEKYPEGIVTMPIKYFDRNDYEYKEAPVTIRFSVVRNEFYNKTAIPGNPGGTTEFGKKFANRLEGISVVRAGREIDFGTFGFYSNLNQPHDRWWGCEISFDPMLDEVFNVSNNKQHVELEWLSDEEYEDDDVRPVWLQLRNIITRTISDMRKRNAEIREGSRTVADKTSPAEKIINKVEEDSSTKSYSESIRDQKPIEAVRQHVKEVIATSDGEPPSEDTVDAVLLNKVSIHYKGANNAHFFDYEFKMGVCICIINTDHIFYKNFWGHIEDNPDSKVAFELFIASLIRTIDETKESRQVTYNELVVEWNEKLRKYIYAQCNGVD